jgi:hypothetical protein
MALMLCPECKAQISRQARTCPSCGGRMRRKPGPVFAIFGGLFLAGMLFVAFHKEMPTTPPPPPTITEAIAAKVEAAARERDYARVFVLHDSMKNPDAFKLVKAVHADSGELCVEYRSTNGFGAVVTESVRFPNDDKKAPVAVPSCADADGKDVTSGAETALKYR